MIDAFKIMDIIQEANCGDCKERRNCMARLMVDDDYNVSRCSRYAKEEEKDMSKGLETLKAVMEALGKGLAEGAKIYEEIEQQRKEDSLNLPTEVTLGVEELKQLKSMYPSQLEKIFKNKKVKLAEDPAVYRVLSSFYPGQLEAIFGKEEN